MEWNVLTVLVNDTRDTMKLLCIVYYILFVRLYFSFNTTANSKRAVLSCKLSKRTKRNGRQVSMVEYCKNMYL